MMFLTESPVLRSTLICLGEGLIAGFIGTFLLTTLVMLLSSLAHAEEIQLAETDLPEIARPGDAKQGQLLFKSNDKYLAAPLLNTQVNFKITGMIARVHLTQEFKNTSDGWQEGIYVFPLPEDAAVDALKMKIGERVIEGQIQERQQAKKTYETAKRQGKKASLIEQERTNIFTNSVANIAPGESIRIEIEYQQLAVYDGGQFHLRFPMVVAPRYIPGKQVIEGFDGSGWAMNTDQVNDAKRITPPVLNQANRSFNPVSIKAELNAGFELKQIHSPYHDIQVEEPSTNQYIIRLRHGATPANRDFELIWQPQSSQQIKAALFTEKKQDKDYALLMMLPGTHSNQSAMQRETIFVIDTSGSMAGESIRQAKKALLLALDRLKAGDRFNVIQFNSLYESLFQSPQAYSHHTLRRAKEYVNNLAANGGTEMAGAMQAALKRYADDVDVRQVIFLTDGSIGNEDQLFQIINNDIADSRLFPIGIGSAPNSNFMNRAARIGRGTFTYIGKVSEVGERMTGLFNKLEKAALTDIEIHWPGSLNDHPSHLTEIWPKSIPDLYQGEPLLIAIQSDKLPDSIQVSGKQAEQEWQAELNLTGGQAQNGISKLWARKKIAALMDERLFHENRKEIEKTITEVALTHHLVSQFTSLVAVDVTPSRIKEELLKTHALATNLPAGWQHDTVFGSLPQTATPALFHILIGLLLSLSSLPLYRFGKRYV